MVDSKKSSSPANVTLEQGLVFLLLAWGVFWGAFVRFYPALSGDTPINDGGLFLMMTEELQNAGFHMRPNSLRLPTVVAISFRMDLLPGRDPDFSVVPSAPAIPGDDHHTLGVPSSQEIPPIQSGGCIGGRHVRHDSTGISLVYHGRGHTEIAGGYFFDLLSPLHIEFFFLP
jgi:hypothetical protein